MLSKILSLAEISGLLKRIPRENLEHFKIGPMGCLLRENLKAEWFYNIVLNRDISVVLSNNDISDTFDYTKLICSAKLPFGIAQMQHILSDELIDNKIDTENIDFNAVLKNEDCIILKCSIFVPPSNSVPMFHQWQRQRRTWWRKFSAVPYRYLIANVKTNTNCQHVEILAKYPWGSQLIETLTLQQTDDNFTIPQLQFKEGKRLIQAHSMITKINLSTMFLNAICDAFDEPVYQEKPRPIFRFHRKLAPHKIAFAVSGSDTSALSELNELCLYLNRKLRTNHISTLLLPSCSKTKLEEQYEQYDQLGIPYTLLLSENTLRNGMIHLRSRDTTLKEQLHVTNLVTYVEQLFKNY